MSLSLFTKVKSKIPKKLKNKDKGIYSNHLTSDFYYGFYIRGEEKYDHKNIDFYSKIDHIKWNQLDLFSNIESTYSSLLHLYSKIYNIDNAFSLYTNIEEKKEKQNLSCYTNISSSQKSDLSLYTKILCPDFKVYIYDAQTGQLINNLNWQLYRRDKTISINQPVDQNHILVDSGQANGLINIYLDDYILRNKDNDFYLRVWKQQDIYTSTNLYISYYYQDYISQVKKCSYIVLKSYLKKEGSGEQTIEKIIYKGAGGGGPVVPTEIKVKSKLICYDEIEALCDLKEKIKVKSKLLSVQSGEIKIKFEGVFYV